MKTELTADEKAFLVYGFALGLAKAAKDDGCFKDFTLIEIVKMILEGI